MIINHNLAANNAIRNMNINSNNASKAMQKLSSGLRINSAADDAAGLAISEKMRGQINGLDQASSNAQDGISMIQTAEGSLNETTSILQRMRELATQAANDTNVSVDRDSIQKEMNQLSSEINRIGNTSEFNTQSLLKGDGTANIAKTDKFQDFKLTGGTVTYTAAVQTATVGAAQTTAYSTSVTLNGVKLTVNAVANATTADNNSVKDVLDATGTASTTNAVAADVYLAGTGSTAGDNATEIAAGLQKLIDSNDSLRGLYKATAATASGTVTITAVAGSAADGSKGNMTALTKTSTGALNITGAAASVGTDNYTAATAQTILGTYGDVLDKGITVNGKTIAFYDGTKGAYTGDADYSVDIAAAGLTGGDAQTVTDAIAAQIGNKISGVTLSTSGAAGSAQLLATADAALGANGNSIKVQDGGIEQEFKATFQVGANQGQQFTIDINDMRSIALKVTGTAGASASVAGASFTSTNTVTDGTSSTLQEASLDVSDATKATAAIKVINNAIESVSAERSKLGAFQNRLEHTINNLGTSSENLTSAESRIRDVDMAKEMSEYSKNNILSQAAQAMLAQANQQPQQVLQLLR